MAAMKAFLVAVTLLGCVSSAQAAQANPIRKVVTMLQSMQAKVEAEGKKEEELFEKFMCYCKTSGGDLQAGIDAAGMSISQLGKDIETSTSLKAETEEDLKQSQNDRSAAKTAMAEATAVREKEAAAFAATKSESDVNIAALTKATAAVEKGSAGAFLQTRAASALRKLMDVDSNLEEEDKETLTAFLSAGQNAEYAPQSGHRKGTNGVSTNGVTAHFMCSDRGTFWVSICQHQSTSLNSAYLFPQTDKQTLLLQQPH